MAQTLDGQVALITGAGKGIGRAIALDLASRGAAVVVTGRDEKAIASVVGEVANGGGRARHLAGDVRDARHLEAAVAKAVETFGGLHVVVANAGILQRVAIGGELARAEAILQTNLFGAYATFAAAVPAMRGAGRLIAVSSALAKVGFPGYAAYSASKAGLIGMVRALAQELAARKITVNAICPGWVDTDMATRCLGELAAAGATTEDQVRAGVLGSIPIGRFIDAEEIARVVAFLCGRDADAINGQALSVCGGITA